MAGYHEALKILGKRLQEPAPGRIQILTGPRQVGKTTMLLEILRQWGPSAIYLAADAPEALLPGWWEVQWRRAMQTARSDKAVLLLDEAQYLPHWSRLLKAAIDEVYREKLPLHIILTGSASLEIGSGARETMAGRYERLQVGHWNARDLAAAFNMDREEAVSCYVRYGSFPGAFNLLPDAMRWKAYIRDSIIDPATGRDLLMLETIRKPALLRQVFAVSAGHPAEIMSLGKIVGEIRDAGALETVSHYLHVLEEAYLITALRKYSISTVRRRASSPKLVPLSNAFMSASLDGEPPSPERDPSRWGRWVENACIAFALNNGQTVHYWREEPLEVDAVCSGTWGQWAAEIKTGDYTSADLAGILEFSRRHPDYRPLVIGDGRHSDTARRIGIDCLTWQEFLWNGIP